MPFSLPAMPEASFRTVDAFIDALGVGIELEPTHGTAPQLTGERRLAYDMIKIALKDATRKKDDAQRRGARAWLQDASAVLSARVCFELLGVNYDAAKSVIAKQWDGRPHGALHRLQSSTRATIRLKKKHAK